MSKHDIETPPKNAVPGTEVPWRCFESEVAAHLERDIVLGEMAAGLFDCTVIEKPKYFSKARDADIEFDVAIELRLNKDSKLPHVIWIWECKDDPNRKVGVGEIEEFAQKLTQVGAHKGTVVTRKGFQSGAVAVAKSLRMGLVTLRKGVHAELTASATPIRLLSVQLKSQFSLSTDGVLDERSKSRLAVILYEELTALAGRATAG